MSALNTFRSTLYFPNINNEIPEFGTTGATGPAGPAGPTGPTGAGAVSMLPLVEGIAYGETDLLGRTMLGYGVDNSSSNSISLWSQGGGLPQGIHNSTMGIELMTDTLCDGLLALNTISVFNGGDVRDSDFGNTITVARNSVINNVSFTQSTNIFNDFTAGTGDSMDRNVAILSGEFDIHPSKFNESILIGNADGLFSQPTGCTAGICIAPRGGTQLIGLETDSCYIGNQRTSKVLDVGEFHLNGFSSFTTDPNSIPQFPGPRLVTYNPGTGEITQDTIENTIGPMQPQILGLALGRQDFLVGNRNNLGYNVSQDSIDSNINYVQTFGNLQGQTGTYQRVNLTSNYDSASDTTSYTQTNMVSNSSTVSGLGLVTSNSNIVASSFSGVVQNSNVSLVLSELSTDNTCNESVIDVISSSTPNSNFVKSVVIGSNLNTLGTNFDNGVLVGDFTNSTLNDCSNSVFICAGTGTTGPSMNSGVTGACYIGNKRRTPHETVTPGQFRVSEFNEFYLRTLRNDVTPDVVYYDPVTSEVTYGSGAGMVPEMTTLIPGTAYGFQGLTGLNNILGRNANESATDSTVLYNQPSAPTTQVMPIANSIVIENSSDTSNVSGCTGTTLIANNYISSVGDSFLDSNVNIRGTFEQPSIVDSSIILGTVDNFRAAGTIQNSITLRPYNVGGLRVQQASNSCLIGPGSAGRSIGTAEFWIDGYANYYINGIRSATGPTYLRYDDTTEEITQSSLSSKEPLLLGGSYGLTGTNTEICGFNSYSNYTNGTTNLNGVSALGVAQFSTLPNTSVITNSSFIGRTFNMATMTSITSSLLIGSSVNFPNMTTMLDCLFITPKAAALTALGTFNMSRSTIISSGTVTLQSDPSGACIVSGGNSTITTGNGRNGVFMVNSGGQLNFSGTSQGNMVIATTNSAATINYPAAINNSCSIQLGAAPILPTGNLQLNSNCQELHFPGLATLVSASNDVRPVVYNTVSGIMSPINDVSVSRVYRTTGTTNGAGQITFLTTVTANAVGTAYCVQVVNTSTTIAYTSSIIATTAGSVTAQIFRSVTVVLASPSMQAAGAGITATLMFAY